MYKTLVIGCGNIGAQYDFDNDQVLTHVKALFLNRHTEVFIYDIKMELAEKVAGKYNCVIVDDIGVDQLGQFDIVSICVPTKYHFQILSDAIEAGVKTVICEKPISNDTGEIALLKEKYLNGSTKILVNYIRRFQKDFTALRSYIQQVKTADRLTNIGIKYQRGFVNNCSHAIDLLEYIFGEQIELDDLKIHNKVFDQFENDATLSLQANWNQSNVSIMGLSNVLFSHFEIDIYFQKQRIAILDAGNTIKYFKSNIEGSTMKPLNTLEDLTQNNCIKDYMVSVIQEAVELTENHTQKDNFINSIELNQRMLNYNNL